MLLFPPVFLVVKPPQASYSASGPEDPHLIHSADPKPHQAAAPCRAWRQDSWQIGLQPRSRLLCPHPPISGCQVARRECAVAHPMEPWHTQNHQRAC